MNELLYSQRVELYNLNLQQEKKLASMAQHGQTNKYRLSNCFRVLPGYQVVYNFQYPDMQTLLSPNSNKVTQTMSLAVRQFSMIAQFGELAMMRTGPIELNQFNMNLKVGLGN